MIPVETEVPKKESVSVMNLNVKILRTLLTNRVNGSSKKTYHDQLESARMQGWFKIHPVLISELTDTEEAFG